MEIEKNISIEDLALFLKKEKTLIIADLHLGYEENLHKQGFLVPWFQYKEIKERLEKILEKTKPSQIIINGDLKHEFGQISQQEWDEVKGILTFLKNYSSDIKLIKGNHDNILGPIAQYKEVELIDPGILLGKIYITHGHKLVEIPKKAKTILIAHEHPALGLTDDSITETYKCFLKGKWENKTLIVQPSFCLVTEGTNILKGQILSPFLDQSLEDFETWTIADKIRYFGKLKNL